jgi:hypothetical protein
LEERGLGVALIDNDSSDFGGIVAGFKFGSETFVEGMCSGF